LLSEYGFDLQAEFEQLSIRRLWVLVRGLPESAALFREQVWSRQDEMLASLLELTDAAIRSNVAVNGGQYRGRPPKPLHVRRPWESEEEARGVVKLRMGSPEFKQWITSQGKSRMH
jgi:hypothetical protein